MKKNSGNDINSINSRCAEVAIASKTTPYEQITITMSVKIPWNAFKRSFCYCNAANLTNIKKYDNYYYYSSPL